MSSIAISLSCFVIFSVLKVVAVENDHTCILSCDTGIKEWSLRVPDMVRDV